MTLEKDRLARMEQFRQNTVKKTMEELRAETKADLEIQNTVIKKARRKRSAKKGFKEPPRPALPVRTLWLTASEEQRKRAHKIGVLMMEYWMGRITKEEVGASLGTSPLRVWQLSQQALSGMLAGLLVQPKTRSKGVIVNKEEDPKYLKKKIAELEKVIQMQDRLIAVMREMPGCKDVTMMDVPPKAPKLQGVKRRAKTAKKIQPGAHHEGGSVVGGGKGTSSP